MNYSSQPFQQTLTGFPLSEDSSGLHALADAIVQRGPLREELAGSAGDLTTPAVQVTYMVDIMCIQK